MKYAALASGSNGNCYYVADEHDAVLIDVGINAKHVELRMHNLNIAPSTVSAIFITHEHTDHIRGLSVFCRRYRIPVYITAGSYHGSRLQLPNELVHIIPHNAKVQIGNLTIHAIPKYHDAKEPCSYVVAKGSTNVAILTDIGRICENVKHVIQHADVLLLEANYDEEMLETGGYPFYLKNRIRNGWGHISNHAALESFLENHTTRLKHLILGHLSGQNNTVDLVNNTFAPYCGRVKLSIATRYAETPLFDYRELSKIPSPVKIKVEKHVAYQTTFTFSDEE